MVYNRPAFAVIGRKSRGVSEPKDLEGKILGAPCGRRRLCAMADLRCRQTASTPSKVKIENVGFPVREPMLAAGQVDAITGLSFSPLSI